VKPVQVVEPLSEYYWLSAAVEPTTGDAFWGELPRLDAACCPVLLRQFGPHDAESLNIVLLDQAPAHVAQRVEVPENVVLIWLPASNPGLHPGERLWEDLKQRIDVLDAQLRSSLTALQAHSAGIIHRYTAEAIASLTGYSYLVEAIDAL
jgi:hypothetical protein